MKRFACLGCVLGIAVTTLAAQQPGWVDPAKFAQPATDSWPTYNGDYSGRRFSTLTKISAANVHALSLGWTFRVAPGLGDGIPIKGTPIMIGGVMYVTVPDHVWALDARTGRELWHYAWESKGGIHIGNRGVGDFRRLVVLRNAGLSPRLVGRQGRQRALAQIHLQPGRVLLRVGCAGGREESRDRRCEWR